MRKIIAITVLFILVPKMAFQCLLAMYRQKSMQINAREFAGLGLRRVQHRTLMINNRPAVDIDTWLHYFKGNIDLVGPSRLEFKTALRLSGTTRERFLVAPGIISPYKIKLASGIAYMDEQQVAVEFANSATHLRRAQLVFVWLVQNFTGADRRRLKTPRSFKLFGVKVRNILMADAVKRVIAALYQKSDSRTVSKFAFVNADCANQIYENRDYKKILNSFDAVYPDGIGVKMAARMQGYALKENVNGTDMFPLLCEQLQYEGKSLYLCGARKKVVRKLVKNLVKQYPKLRIAGYSDGFTYSDRPNQLCDLINAANADLLLVAMGAPRQEQWIRDNACKLNVKAVMGVGGLFDFYSGEVSRAPVWLRELSMEWVWRLLQQPRDKVKRYLIGNPLFIIRSLRHSMLNKSLSTV